MAGTRWVKIDTSYLRNPKIIAISPHAVLLHLASILWTADQLTDGHIPSEALPELEVEARISRRGNALETRTNELTKRALWVPNGDGFELHDFTSMNHQATRARVEKQRQVWRTAKGGE
jgi:hypothetical protein